MKPITSGMNIIIFCWEGSPPVAGVIFCMMNWLMIIAIGRMRIGICSGCERSVTHSHYAPRMAMDTDSTL